MNGDKQEIFDFAAKRSSSRSKFQDILAYRHYVGSVIDEHTLTT
jgi:hypothetical protein